MATQFSLQKLREWLEEKERYLLPGVGISSTGGPFELFPVFFLFSVVLIVNVVAVVESLPGQSKNKNPDNLYSVKKLHDLPSEESRETQMYFDDQTHYFKLIVISPGFSSED